MPLFRLTRTLRIACPAALLVLFLTSALLAPSGANGQSTGASEPSATQYQAGQY